MQGLIRCALVAGILCACHSDDTTSPDGHEDGEGGLKVKWSSRPGDVPVSLGSNVTLTSARFALDSLREIGDAGPGDLRTTEESIDLSWEMGQDPPQDVEFSEAPSGLYSQISLQIDGHVTQDSYTFHGTAIVNSNLENFEISDNNPLAVMLAIDKSVSPGTTSTIDIEIDFEHAISVVDFSSLNKSDGELQLSEGDPGIVEFRKKLIESFKTPNIAPH